VLCLIPQRSIIFYPRPALCVAVRRSSVAAQLSNEAKFSDGLTFAQDSPHASVECVAIARTCDEP
jgi:hypothetical protein